MAGIQFNKMKIEICDNTYWLTLWSVIAISFFGLMFGLSFHYTERVKAAFAAGYQESTGRTGGYWIKQEDK